MTITPAHRLQEAIRCHNSGQLARAMDLYRELLWEHPAHGQALCLLGLAFLQTGQREEGLVRLRRAVLSDHAATAWQPTAGLLRQALAHARLGYWPEARPQLEELCQMVGESEDGRDPWQDLATLHLAQGRFEEGWAALANRRQMAPAGDIPLWTGEDLKGETLLLHGEGSLTAFLLTLRHVPLARQQATVVLAAPAFLVQLLEEADLADQVVAMDQPWPAVQARLPMLDLPRLFQTATLPTAVPYVRVSVTREQAWQQRLACHARPLIGLVQQGENGENQAALHRLTEQVTAIGGTWLNLDSPSCPDAIQLPNGLEPMTDGWADLAAAMLALDLVIAVESPMAHLAAALGCPVWLLLAHAPDWLLTGENSPWYEAMHLFRSAQPGDWTDLLDQVQEGLRWYA